MSEFSVDVGSQDFQQKVIEASRRVPVVVDFWAPWCGPCRTLGPILEKLAGEFQGRFILAKVNSDQDPELSMQYGVRGIPAVKAFVDGRLADEFTGALPESAVREFLQSLMPSPAEPLRQQARQALARGDAPAARRLLGEAVQLDPRNEAARLDLAELLVTTRDFDDARSILDEIAPGARDGARLEALQARLTLARASSGDADPAALQARIAADPGDLEARLEWANLLALSQEYRPAMDQLLEVVRRDRGFRDDAARTTLVALFNLLGSDSDLVREYRRELAAALNR
ncbi:MAG: co-chaperone YbbN [Betaproteobacteria bacterium]|nr:co-chaperone YbbN [Betaproteobacteria bacterium]